MEQTILVISILCGVWGLVTLFIEALLLAGEGYFRKQSKRGRPYEYDPTGEFTYKHHNPKFRS